MVANQFDHNMNIPVFCLFHQTVKGDDLCIACFNKEYNDVSILDAI